MHKVPACPPAFSVLLLPPASQWQLLLSFHKHSHFGLSMPRRLEGADRLKPGAVKASHHRWHRLLLGLLYPGPGHGMSAAMWPSCSAAHFSQWGGAQGRTQPQCCFSCFPGAQPCCGSLAQPINASGKEEYASLQHINSKSCLVEDFFSPQATQRCIYLLGKQQSIKWPNVATGKDCCP